MVRHRIVIRNRGAHDVAVSKVLVSCACTGVGPTQFVVPSNGSIEIAMSIDPVRLEQSAQDEKGHFEIRLALFEQGSRIPQQWVFRGRVESPIVLSLQEVLFYGPNAPVSGRSEPKLALNCRTRNPEWVVELARPPQYCDISCTRRQTGNAEWTIVLRPRNSLSVGDFEEHVWLRVRQRNRSIVGEWPIRVAGHVEPVVVVFPESIDLYGNADRERCSVIMRSNDGRDFRVMDAGRSRHHGIQVLEGGRKWSTNHELTIEVSVRQIARHRVVTVPIVYRDGTTADVPLVVAVHRVFDKGTP